MNWNSTQVLPKLERTILMQYRDGSLQSGFYAHGSWVRSLNYRDINYQWDDPIPMYWAYLSEVNPPLHVPVKV